MRPSLSIRVATFRNAMLERSSLSAQPTTTFATFGGTVQGNAITVDATGNVDTGSGFATIKPTNGATLTDLIFTPADDTLFSDFSFPTSIVWESYRMAAKH